MKFFCVRDRKRHNYKDMAQVCTGCALYRCNAYAYAERHGYLSIIPESLMGAFSGWFEK